MARLLIAYVLAFGVGMFCRYFEIPAPAPPVLPGALLVVAMTLGYAMGDKILPKKNPDASMHITSTTQPGNTKDMQK